MTKQQIRHKYRQIRTSILNPQEKSFEIYQKLIHLSEFINASRILSYYSTSKEPSTRKLNDHILSIGKELYLPFIHELKIGQVNLLEEMKQVAGEYFEPLEESNTNDFDLILVPGIAFDNQNNRLGGGLGWYDRFLKTVTGIKVGVCFKEQIYNETLPIEEMDVGMYMVVTD